MMRILHLIRLLKQIDEFLKDMAIEKMVGNEEDIGFSSNK
jgi:hypothetical protein